MNGTKLSHQNLVNPTSVMGGATALLERLSKVPPSVAILKLVSSNLICADVRIPDDVMHRDYYVDNYLVGQGSASKSCGPDHIGSMAGNTYVTVAGNEHDGGMSNSISTSNRGRRQQGNCWPTKQVTMTVEQIEAIGRGLIGLP